MLHVHAVDGDPATATSQRSGVRNISVKIDGDLISNQQLDQSCTCPEASCPGDLDFAFDVFDYAPGQHTVSVSATDQVGNSSPEQAWTINVGAGEPNDKVAFIDQGTDGAVLDQADDQSTACPTDPDAGPDGPYCNPDDAGNDEDSIEYARAAATSGSTAALAKDGPGWGIADQNSLASTQRTDGTNSYANMFVDALFTATHVKTVRRVVPWDVATRGTTPRSQTMGYGSCRSGTAVSINGNQTQDVNGDGSSTRTPRRATWIA